MNIQQQKRKEIHLITTDLDGTLLNRKSTLSNFNRDILVKARNQGIIVVLNSGRPYSAIKDRIPSFVYDYASCMNGQDIYSLKDQQHWENARLNRNEIEQLFSLGNKYPVIMDCKSADYHIQACNPNYKTIGKLFAFIHDTIWKIRGYHPQITALVTNVKDIPMSSAGKYCFAGNHKVLCQIKQQLPTTLHGTFVNTKWLEVQRKEVNKGFALKEILHRENISKENVVGFGDGENDISMLEECKYKIAMANAMPKTKKIATEITKSNHANGVGIWLEHNIF